MLIWPPIKKGIPINPWKCFSLSFTVILLGLFTSCSDKDPDLPRYPGAKEIAPRVLYLGDVFDRVNEYGELEWDGQPVPGASIKLLLVADGTYNYANSSSASLRPFDQPFSNGIPMEASLGKFRTELKTAHRFVEIQIPGDVSPGFHWLEVGVDSIEFGPFRIEIADPDFVELRTVAFTEAEEALKQAYPGMPFLLTGLMAPIGSEGLRKSIKKDSLPLSAWPFFATRLDDRGAIVLDAEQVSDLMVLVDANSGVASIHTDFGLANWTLYNYPSVPPRAGYNGWWWKQPNLPAGGTCGTAWCNYPFPGNRVRTVYNRLAIDLTPPDPYEWWQGRGDGWVCGNGWFYGRRGPGGYRLGPWWPTNNDGKPKPDLGGPMPEKPVEGTPPPVSTPRRPPGLQPPPTPVSCSEEFVEAVSKYTYGKPPYGTRGRAAKVGGKSAIYNNLPLYEGNLRWARIPKNWTRNGGYEYGWSQQEANAELQRNQDWWAKYCINLSRNEVVLPDTRKLRRFAQRYKRWIDALPQGANPNVVMGLGDKLTNEGVDLYKEARNLYAQAIGRRQFKGALHILFMPRVVARIGHTGSRSRPTETSFTDPAVPFSVLNELDKDDPYILVHELIHALGRPPGENTWDHQSGDPRAMSRVTRRTVRQPAGLSASRLLDYAEYHEILASGNLKPRRP